MSKEVKETILHFQYKGKWNVRVWREFPTDKPLMATHEIHMERGDIQKVMNQQPYVDQNLLAADVLKIDRVNAVEVKEINGDGVVLYKEWP